MCAVVAICVAAGFGAQAIPPRPQELLTLATALERGPLSAREEALSRILKVPPDQWSPEVWKALTREAIRMRQHFHEPVTSDDDADVTEYTWAVSSALAKSRDPTVIPVLMTYGDASGDVTDGLVRFGEIAISALLPVATTPGIVEGDDGFDVRGGAVVALSFIAERWSELSPASQAKLSQLAEDLLGPGFSPAYAGPLVRLVFATGRDDLKAHVRELASTDEAWTRRGVSDAALIRLERSIVNYTLGLVAKK